MDNKLRTMRTRHMRSGSAILQLIRRSFVLAGLCIFSDIAIALLITTIHKNFPDAIFAPLAMYDLNLIINLVCILLTFRNWNTMIFPWLYKWGCKEKTDNSVFHRSSARGYVTNPGAKSGVQLVCENKEFCDFQQKQGLTSHQKVFTDDMQRLSERQSKLKLTKAQVESLKADSQVTDYSQNNKSDVFYYSDTVLQICQHETFQCKRSASVTFGTANTPGLTKRAKSYMIISLLNKSKYWLLGHKAFQK